MLGVGGLQNLGSGQLALIQDRGWGCWESGRGQSGGNAAISHKVHAADTPKLWKILHLEEHLAHAGDVDAGQDSLGTEKVN